MAEPASTPPQAPQGQPRMQMNGSVYLGEYGDFYRYRVGFAHPVDVHVPKDCHVEALDFFLFQKHQGTFSMRYDMGQGINIIERFLSV